METIIAAIDIFGYILTILIFARVVCSWLPFSRENILIKYLYLFTEPILAPIRNLIYKSPLGGAGMVLDFSPVLAGLLIQILTGVIINVLRSF